MRQQLKYFEVQLEFNPDPEKTASIQAGLLTASQEIDATIAKLGVPLAKLPTTPEETSRIIKAVTETRNLPTTPRLQQQQHTRTLTQSQSNRSNVKISSDPQLDNPRVRRSADKDGFIPSSKMKDNGSRSMPITNLKSLQLKAKKLMK
ncbi:hypothetical protein CEXT_441401 [Caerostris extrusa]|uniref:Uncharacterized protein n=1 Tax=Caerostris extrusa TaxID=172846 RepID=A0AAV4Q2E6_CAEEX|nr:hypothetical protein CEXT_441401 [Caerostris extrusa]